MAMAVNGRRRSASTRSRASGQRMTGAQLRVQREFLGFSRSQLANILGITAGVIADWENGRDPIPYHLAGRIGGIVRFTDDYLRALEDVHRGRGPVLTYRTDTAYKMHHPNPVYTASWHRGVCARLLHSHPGLTVEFHGGRSGAR